jgi:Family of unknown function (DUF6424)
MAGTHSEHEDFPWMIAVVDHPPRSDSPAYVRSRALMRKLVATTPDWTFAGDSYQDHHGGSVWVKDAQGWLCLQVPLGIEWSAQFCADPARVDGLRQYAARVVAGFPDTLPGYEALGYHDGASLLATPITDADGVAAWTDSIFNASLPLPAGTHSGVLPAAAGYHHYPKPIVDIDHFRFSDFQLFVTDPAGLPAVVVPVGRRGSGDARVRLLAAHPASAYARRLPGAGAGHAPVAGGAVHAAAVAPAGQAAPAAQAVAPAGQAGPAADPDVLAADDPLARQAFARQ